VKGDSCRSFLSKVDQRLKLRIQITPEYTDINIGHGMKKAYIIICQCNEGEETGDTEFIYAV